MTTDQDFVCARGLHVELPAQHAARGLHERALSYDGARVVGGQQAGARVFGRDTRTHPVDHGVCTHALTRQDMSVYSYSCASRCKRACAHTHIHIHARARARTHARAHKQVRAHTHTHTVAHASSPHARPHTHTSTYTRTHACARARETHTHTLYARTHTHKHTHTHTRAATLGQMLQFQLVLSPSHIMLTPGQPFPSFAFIMGLWSYMCMYTYNI